MSQRLQYADVSTTRYTQNGGLRVKYLRSQPRRKCAEQSKRESEMEISDEIPNVKELTDSELVGMIHDLHLLQLLIDDQLQRLTTERLSRMRGINQMFYEDM